MISIVIPLLNEEKSLDALADSIAVSMRSITEPYQIIFVDDGSTDGSWAKLQAMVAASVNLSAIRLRRNFGKAAALSAGFDAATGEVIVTMDADLQDDPKEIPRFIDKMNEGFDVVSGWKRVRHDPWHKTLPSAVFNRMVSWLTGVQLNDHNCGFKSYRAAIFKEVKLYGELHRFVPVLASARGWKIAEIEVEHHARSFGKSKYGISRLPKGFLDLLTIYFLTSFSQRPLHLMGSAGLLGFLSGSLGLASLSLVWIASRLWGSTPFHLHKHALFYFCITAILLGAQFLVAGLLAELMTAIARQNRSPSSVADAIGFGRPNEAANETIQ